MWVTMRCAGTEDVHVFAVPDKIGHRIAEGGQCPCGAYVRPENPRIVLHRSADQREIIEEAEEILKGEGTP